MSELATTRPYVAPYVVHVEGNDITVKDVMVAADIYRLRLEEHIGEPARVVKCFRAWSKAQDPGVRQLTKSETRLAKAWCDAHDAADRAARKLLSCPSTLRFDFRLR